MQCVLSTEKLTVCFSNSPLNIWAERNTVYGLMRALCNIYKVLILVPFLVSWLNCFLPSVLWRCWFGGRKGIRPVKTERWGAGMVISLEQGTNLHMAQLMPLPLTVSCFSKIQTMVLPFWYRLTWVVPEKGPLNGCVCVRACVHACVCVVVYWH